MTADEQMSRFRKVSSRQERPLGIHAQSSLEWMSLGCVSIFYWRISLYVKKSVGSILYGFLRNHTESYSDISNFDVTVGGEFS